MKYFIACLIIPVVQILFFAAFGVGALCFGLANLLERMRKLMSKHSTGYIQHQPE